MKAWRVVVAGLCLAVLWIGVPVRAAMGTNLCPNDCNGHGHCGLGDEELCECWEPFNDGSPTCARQPCPVGNSWFDTPDATGQAHLPAECSNRGRCNYETGTCTCSIGFDGAACERMTCPAVNMKLCNGHGVCRSMKDAALPDTRYDDWDAEQMFGCVCDAGWTGHNCVFRECPMGDDPYTTGTREIQVIRTDVTHQDEVQSIAITGADVDEIQSLILFEPLGGTNITGTIRILFNTTDTDTCRLCSGTRGEEYTSYFDFTTVTAAELETHLEGLANIDDVTVNFEAINSDTDEGFNWTVTFDGVGVGGNVPELELDAERIFPEFSFTAFTEVLNDGSELQGTVSLDYDDVTYPDNHPAGAVGTTGVVVDMTASASELQTTINAMNNIINGVTVSKVYTGGPGVQWLVTFLDLGNRKQWDLGTDGLTAIYDADPRNIGLTTVQDGSFLDGTFRVSYLGVATGDLTWEQDATTVETSIEALDTGLGEVTVNRQQQFTGTVDDWSGGYDWVVTFLSHSGDVTDLVVDTDALTGAGGTDDNVAIGTGSVPLNGVEVTGVDGEVNEVQLIECSCATPCSGTFKLDVVGSRTATIEPSDTPATLRTKLMDLSAINDIIVSSLGSSNGFICDPDGVTTGITFTHNPGNVEGMAVAEFALVTGGVVDIDLRIHEGSSRGDNGYQAKQGTRVLQECSGRGVCNQNSGECDCYAEWWASDGGGGEVSPGNGTEIGAGARRDCGFPGNPTTCPVSLTQPVAECSGRGTCSGSPNYVCTCDDPTFATGGACDRLLCPSDEAWWNVQTVETAGHAVTECSNRGKCEYSTGHCSCDGGFGGDSSACEVFACPNCGPGSTCNLMANNAPLAFDRTTGDEIANLTYSGWDANKIQGCVCDRFYYTGWYEYDVSTQFGAECRFKTCPLTDDPKTTDQVFEVQEVLCVGDSGSILPRFRSSVSPFLIAVDDGADAIKFALESIPSINYVTVTMNETFACGLTYPTAIQVTFVSNFGDLPLLKFDTNLLVNGEVDVYEVTAGTTDARECSGRGTCDYSTGRCECAPQYGSSDGSGNVGRLGDCGNLNALHRFGQSNLPAQLRTNNSNLAFT